MNKCYICEYEIYGYGGIVKMPLCKEHYMKTIQLASHYHDHNKESYFATDKEWDAVREILGYKDNSSNGSTTSLTFNNEEIS